MKLIKFFWSGIFIIVLWWIIYFFVFPKVFIKKEIEIPNLVGLKEIEAINILDNNNIKYNIVYVNGDDNIVVNTYPEYKTKIYEEYVIDVYIEKNIPKCYPLFVNKLFDDVINDLDNLIKEYDINYEISYVKGDYVSGIIISQSKGINEEIKNGYTIKFVVGLSNNSFCMPNLIGMNLFDAMKILDENNIIYDIIYYPSAIDEDIVLSQSILPGRIYDNRNKDKVEIVVSRGMVLELETVYIDEIFDLTFIDDISIIYVNSTEDYGKILKIEKDDIITFFVAG